jgi:RNA polymerase sigma-70 factor (ECF subfamily)
MWTTLLSAFSSDDDDDHDPLETLATDEDDAGPKTPESKLLQAQTLNLIEDEIKRLPARQREAFLMRYWEDMDVAETAAAMGCSEGSVKTHCSRATHTLATALSAKGIKL